jgi:branched-chain amino acid transport system ATP-binding protein
MLALNNVEVIYDHVILVLKGVSLNVPKGSIVALLGANGAGKSTTLKAVSNLLLAERGKVTKGAVEFMGARVDGLSPSELVRRGCIQVMEGRHCFGHLTVEENLLTGAYTRSGGAGAVRRDLDMVYSYFPRLRERRLSLAGYVSGGGGSPRSWSRRSSRSSSASTASRACPCCWPSRTPTWRSSTRATATSSRTAAW